MLERVLAEQRGEAVTYDAVGATQGTMPDGYRADRYELVLGQGDDVFRRAVDGLLQWEAHRGAGLRLCPKLPAIEVGTTLVAAVPLGPISAIAACRIVAVEDRPDRFGFAYGTLPAHPEEGEEAFAVERDEDGTVRFAIWAFSKPRHPVARYGAPLGRLIQIAVNQNYLEGLRKFVVPEVR